MHRQIWLIGGTQESVHLATELIRAHLPCLITVTTESARSLYPISPFLQLWVGKLTTAQLPGFLQRHQIHCILDASHPYAVEISQLAIDVATQFQLPYLRYERPALPPQAIESCLYLNSFEELITGNTLLEERVLLTLGYRNLALFQQWHDRATLFARLLPSVAALEAALAAGFTPDRLIALRPPLSLDLERALWQHWNLSMVVTKASGSAGGEDIKRQIAAELGIKLVIINRPTLAYPQQTSDMDSAIAFCQHHLPPIQNPKPKI